MRCSAIRDHIVDLLTPIIAAALGTRYARRRSGGDNSIPVLASGIAPAWASRVNDGFTMWRSAEPRN